MPPLFRRNASFVVRIWWERRRDRPPVWRGQIIHVQTGQTLFFQRAEALITFIGHWTGTVEESDNLGS